MQSTNTGILKPALWHTPAITNDGIIRQAPDIPVRNMKDSHPDLNRVLR